MSNTKGIYQEWMAVYRDTWYTTRSPYPKIDCYISPVALPTCRNYSSYLPAGSPVDKVGDYLEQQVLILKFNNPEQSSGVFKNYISNRLAFWKGNNILTKDPYYLNKLLDIIIEDCFNERSSTPIKDIKETKYWYSDRIAKMSGEGIQSSDRTKAKQKARYAIVSEGTKDDLRETSVNYKYDNFDILPTIKILIDKTFYSYNTVVKHGKGFYIPRVENINQRVQKAKEVCPEYTQQEIADLIEESKRTVRDYWRTTQGGGDIEICESGS